MKVQFSVLLLVSLFQVSVPLNLVQAQENRSVFDRLCTTEVLEMEIVTDLNLLRSQKNTNEYQPATLSYETGKKETESWDIKIRSRGKYRRRVCVFPPLKLNFPKEVLKERGFNKDDEIKLITHCLEGDPGKDFLLREYLVYKIYEKLSPVCVRVQLTRVRYRDPETGEKINAWGILMEDEKALERRFNAEICDDCYSFPKEGIQPENLTTVYLFEYLIGNTDWSLPMVRNLILLRPKDGSGALLIPYDFDFSGFVNASYARPNLDFKQTSIRERLFLGQEIQDAELTGAIEHFRNSRKELEGIIKDFKLLFSESRADLLNFLDGFYLSLEQGIKRPSPE